MKQTTHAGLQSLATNACLATRLAMIALSICTGRRKEAAYFYASACVQNFRVCSICRSLATIFVLMTLPTGASAQNAILRNGSCPPGYNTSGNYCIKTDYGRPAIDRVGACPPGYSTSGNYCLRSEYGRPAIERHGSCPPGYSTSGNYCVRNR